MGSLPSLWAFRSPSRKPPPRPMSTPCTSRRIVLCDGLLPRDQRTRLRYFDTSCFAVSAPGTFGNAGRDLWHGPGINNWDMSAFKNFALGSERWKLQFRGETFNLFNHTQFNNPTQFSSERDVRADSERQGSTRIMQMALRMTF